MKKRSAGILLYRKKESGVEVLLVHPGGPYFKNKDAGAWTIPKGEPEEGEDLLNTALREFDEELGIRLNTQMARELKPVVQKGGKEVIAFAIGMDLDCSRFTCNKVSIEFPYKSGKYISFPEIDQAEWFSLDVARKKMNQAQVKLLDELAETIGTV